MDTGLGWGDQRLGFEGAAHATTRGGIARHPFDKWRPGLISIGSRRERPAGTGRGGRVRLPLESASAKPTMVPDMGAAAW